MIKSPKSNIPLSIRPHSMLRPSKFVVIIVIIALGVTFISRGKTIQNLVAYPGDANIVNAKTDFGAKGDGVSDDTIALRAAFKANDWVDNPDANDPNPAVGGSAARTVYIPEGVYVISSSIIIEGSNLRIVGAGSDRTILKLKDGVFTNVNQPQIMLKTGNAFFKTSNLANTGFSNYIQDLTVDTGNNNPGAIGVRYDVANTGAMQNVTIRSGSVSKSGVYGLYFTTSPGPAFVQNVTIDGFNHGVYLDDKMTNVITFQDITLRNQLISGITNQTKNIVVEGLITENVPIAISAPSNVTTLVMINSVLNGKGSGSAIDTGGFVYVRNVQSSGFANIIKHEGSSRFVGASTIKEWSTHNYRVGSQLSKTWKEANQEYVGLNLPIKKAPTYHNPDLTKWINAALYVQSGDNGNFGLALQRAIDAANETKGDTVYVPYGAYTISNIVEIRGHIKKLDFMHAMIDGSGKISAGNVVGDSIIVENVDSSVIFEQNGPDSFVVRNLSPAGGGFYTGSNATGDMFIENAGAHAYVNLSKPISFWARSIDRVTSANKPWVNNGGNIVCISCNIETRWSPSTFTNGSKTEIIGGTLDNLSETYAISGSPLFTVQDSFISIVTPGLYRSSSALWGHILYDRSGSHDVHLYNDDFTVTNPQSSGDKRLVLPMYVTPNYTYPIISAPKRCDINNDGLVNNADLAILLANYRKSGSVAQGDCDDNGYVDIVDLSIMISNWSR